MATTYYQNEGVWTYWTTTSLSATSGNDTWTYWTDASATTSTASTAWVNWNEYHQHLDATIDNNIRFRLMGDWKVADVVISPEQIAEQNRRKEEERKAREIRMAEARRLADEERARKKEATRKSRELLVSLLSKDQVVDLEKTGSFGFVGASGKVYRIKEGWSHNIVMDDNGKKQTLCCHPKKAVPIHDNMTAQLLLLKYQEEDFIKMANKGRL
jgi:hypothetical protein